MGPFTAIITCLRKYFDFSGRARRAEYWWYVILYTGVVTVGVEIRDSTPAIITAVALFIPFWSVGARRMHDIGKSGWWQLVTFVPYAGWVFLLYWTVKRGDPGWNEYGSPPGGNRSGRPSTMPGAARRAR